MQELGASTQRTEAGEIDPARRVNGADAACRGVDSARRGALTQGGGADAGPGGSRGGCSLNKKEPSRLDLGERDGDGGKWNPTHSRLKRG